MAESKLFNLCETPELMNWRREKGDDGESRWVTEVIAYDFNWDLDVIDENLYREKVVSVVYPDETTGLYETARVVAAEIDPEDEESMYLRLWLSLQQLRSLASYSGIESNDL